VSEEVPADADVSCWGYYLLGIRRWSERRRAASSEARPERIRVDPARLPDPARLVEEVLSRGAGSRSMIHGPAHWRHVAYFGWCVLAGEPRVDPLVVFLFSLFHDAMRESDGHDPEHGRRGSKLARDLHGKAHFITDSQMRLLDTACAGHADGYTSADPTIGACWDADRLTLWRVGRKPNPALLSTERGRGPAIINAAKHIQHGTPPGWQTLFRLYGLIDSKEPAPLPEGPIVPEHLHSFWGQVEHGKREMLKRWGLLEEYDRMQAEPGRTLAKSAPPSTSSLMDLAQKPWKETPWK